MFKTEVRLRIYAVMPLCHYDYICLISNSTRYGNHILRFQSVQLCFYDRYYFPGKNLRCINRYFANNLPIRG